MLLLTGCILARPELALTQQRAKRIGLLFIKSERDSAYIEAFRDRLREMRYAVGKDVEIDEHFLVDRYPLLADAATRLVAAKVDVIVSWGSTSLTAVSKATKTIPIVASTAADPVAAGFAVSFSHPGKNITGITTFGIELGGKRLELLKRMLPALRVVGLPLNSDSAREAESAKNLAAHARQLNLELRPILVRVPSDFESAIGAASKSGIQALAPMPSTMFVANPQALLSAVDKSGLPAIYHAEEFTRAGGLLSYGTSQTKIFRQLAPIVDRVLKGTKPSEIPFEQPTTFRLVVNLKAAEKLGLTVPRELVTTADELIQ